jgi:hypothetical protein
MSIAIAFALGANWRRSPNRFAPRSDAKKGNAGDIAIWFPPDEVHLPKERENEPSLHCFHASPAKSSILLHLTFDFRGRDVFCF